MVIASTLLTPILGEVPRRANVRFSLKRYRGEQIGRLRVKFTRLVPMLDFRNPFSAATQLNGTESVFPFTGRIEIEALRLHEIELWRSRRLHYRHAAGHG